MRRHCQNILLLSFLISYLVGCQMEVPVDQLPYESRVVIQGIIEPDSVPIVYFNRTIPFLTGSIKPADLVIRHANVVVGTLGETQLLKLDSAYDRIDCKYVYYYKGSIPIKADAEYSLDIIAGEQRYRATANTYVKSVVIDSVSYTANYNDLFGAHEGVITYFQDVPGQLNYYRFEMSRMVDSTARDATIKTSDKPFIKPCLEQDSIYFTELGRSVYDDQNLDGSQIKIVIEPALTHTKDITVRVRIQSIDKAAFDFYNQLDGQKLALYNPFVEPYFLRDGQFGKTAFGFFGCQVKSGEVEFRMPADN